MDLGAFLTALHTPVPAGPLRLDVATWEDPAASHAAFLAGAQAAGGALVVFGSEQDDAEPEPSVRVEQLTLWRGTDERARLDVRDDGGQLTRRVVVDGERWWSWYEEDGARSNEDDLEVGGPSPAEELAPLLDGWGLAGLLRFGDPGEDVLDGRRVLTARAHVRTDLRTGEGWALHRLGMGVEELLLTVDPATGVVLEAETRRGGAPLKRWTVREVAFGADVEAQLAFESPDGSVVRGLRDDEPEHLPLHEVGAGVGFTVWVARDLEDRFDVHAMRRLAGEHWHVSLLYHSHTAGYGFSVAQVAPGARLDGFQPREPWEQRTVDGHELQVHELRESMGGASAFVRLEREGTQLELQGTGLDADALVRIALAMVPAPDAPPA